MTYSPNVVTCTLIQLSFVFCFYSATIIFARYHVTARCAFKNFIGLVFRKIINVCVYPLRTKFLELISIYLHCYTNASTYLFVVSYSKI